SMKKFLLVILDGVADKKSALAKAKKPNIDLLAANSACGLWSGPHAPHYNKRSLSSVATLEILGYSWRDEPGRGYLEALGIGLKPKSSICVRGNFANVKKGKMIDRRAGRDEKGLDVLVKDLNRKIKSINGVKVKLHRAFGHRLVLVMSGKNLDRHVSDSDSGTRVQKIRPLDRKAKKAAETLNRYAELSSAILSSNPLNKKRKVPANFILLRAAGAQKKAESFRKKFKLSACSISGVNIIRGTSKYLGIDVVDAPLTQLEDDLPSRARKAVDALERYDFVILHINGCDTNAHNRDFGGKVRFIEKIDREVFSQLLKLRHINIGVISDHITDSASGEHVFGPVPFMLYAADEENESEGFDEKVCAKGFMTDSPMKKIMSLIFSQ
ncbi:MAG: hypothetical protein HY517_01655, partial [Candidatus Aenigmarchaeota archaeon]|nr:hypothetical protein [Candidatus Aenigmarchaeota archaeon]